MLSSFVTCFCFYSLFSFHWHILRKPALCWESFTLSPHKGSIRVVYRSASILQPFLILSICALKTGSMSRIKKHFFNPLNLQERPEKPFWSLKPLHHSPRPSIKYVSLNIFFIPQPCIAFNCNSIPMHRFSLEIFDCFTTLKCNTSSHKQLV